MFKTTSARLFLAGLALSFVGCVEAGPSPSGASATATQAATVAGWTKIQPDNVDRFGGQVAIWKDRLVTTERPAEGSSRVHFLEVREGNWETVGTFTDRAVSQCSGFLGPFSELSEVKIQDATAVVPCTNAGSYAVFRRESTTWTVAQTVTAPVDGSNGRVDLDGNRLAIGAPADNRGDGEVHVFSRPSVRSDFSLDSTLSPQSSGQQLRFGESVALDGDRLAVGVPNLTNSDGEQIGGVDLFELKNGSWVRQTRIDSSPGQTGVDRGGRIEFHAENVLMGSTDPVFPSFKKSQFFRDIESSWMPAGTVNGKIPFDLTDTRAATRNPDSGSFIWIYGFEDGTWNQKLSFVPPKERDFVADLHTDRLVIGMPFAEDDAGGSSRGALYVRFLDYDADGIRNARDNCPDTSNRAQNDRDDDGVGDRCDGCPSDANKTEPKVCGCGNSDVDGDNDGTLDCNDGCPTNPERTEPGPCGCSGDTSDADGDGTPACNDDCPRDPNKTAPGACGCGTPDTDRDGDGVADCNDACPDNPSRSTLPCSPQDAGHTDTGMSDAGSADGGPEFTWGNDTPAESGCHTRPGAPGMPPAWPVALLVVAALRRRRR